MESSTDFGAKLEAFDYQNFEKGWEIDFHG